MGFSNYRSSMRWRPPVDILFQYELSCLHLSKNSAILLLASSPLLGSIWKPETPSTMISAGPPWLVAKVGNPQFIASITVRPNASYNAGYKQQKI